MTIQTCEVAVIDRLAQNIAATSRRGMGGVAHAGGATKAAASARLSGDQEHHSSMSGLELEEAR